MPYTADFMGCCGLSIIYSLLPGLSEGQGTRKYDPIKIHEVKFNNRGTVIHDPEERLKLTLEKIETAKNFTIKSIKDKLKESKKAQSGTIITVTHAQFIVVGKELYDLGYIAIVNNSISTLHNNRIIIMFRENEHKANQHQTVKGFTYDEVKAAIDKYELA